MRIILPSPYEAQKKLVYWREGTKAQCLVAPSGTKSGKSFGSALWMVREALLNPGLYCAWIAPTYMKCKIGYRYIKAFLPDHDWVDCVDSRLEITLANRSTIKFLHGRDAETTVEGEAIDRFVIDESGKQSKQLWFSLLTTISQTNGCGIATGTPRGFTWYYDIFRRAQQGDPFFDWMQLETCASPFVKPIAVEQAKRLLPKPLFDQYYRAIFVTMSTVFGDLDKIFDDDLKVNPQTRFWVHPDAEQRAIETVTGWDLAKHQDYTVFYTVNIEGKLVGYARFRHVPYEHQVDRLKIYLDKYFTGDKLLRYDATGVGDAVGEIISQKDIDASITPVIFSQRSKQEMVSRTTIAIDSDWHKAPRIEQILHEFGSYELTVTKSGLFSYSAPDGEHDDVVSAAILAVSGAYMLSIADAGEKFLEDYLISGDIDEDIDDEITAAASEFSRTKADDFFEKDLSYEDFELDYN